MNYALEIAGLSYTYPDGTAALEAVDLTVEKGERIAVIGANGAGKSTLLYHLNGLLQGKGRVKVMGMEIRRENLREIREKVGLVFQNPDDQLFCPTLYDDIAFGPRNLGLNKAEIEARADSLMERFNLKTYRNKSALHLSYGQKKLAALAAVLALGPQILALDEPTDSLDPRGKKMIISLLHSLQVTLITVTHDLDLIRQIADTAVLMHQGRIVRRGTVDDVLNDEEGLKRAELI